MNGANRTGEVTIQLPETKMLGGGAAVVGGVARPAGSVGGRVDVARVALRLACLLTSVTALSVMVTAKQRSTISLYGFELPVYSKWSFSQSLQYLVGISAAVAFHSLVQLLISSSRALQKSAVIPSRKQAWLIFAGDQVFTLAMMSAVSAASGVTNLNRTGIKHSPLPNFCKALNVFCERSAVSIGFAFFSCFLLAMSVVLDVIWLSKH